jgi:hypothetical protein
MDAVALAFYFVVTWGPDFMTDWREEGSYRTLAECHQAATLVTREVSECYATNPSRLTSADDPVRGGDAL